ncbi:MAG: Ribosome maturation factor rimP [Bacteroidota bacterium]|nr:Ribosome maturation factor rimP [Bacteroidota bacterium]
MRERGRKSPLLFSKRTVSPNLVGDFKEEEMDFGIVKDKIEEWLTPLLEEKNLFLVDVKFSMGRKLEVYVDSDEGIHIDDCATISRFLEKHLDGSGIVPDNYILEVSSPGMDNPLRIPRQYKRRIGRILEVVKNDGTNIEAQLVEVGPENILLREVKPEVKKKKKPAEEQPAKEFVVRYDEIKKAVLQFKF